MTEEACESNQYSPNGDMFCYETPYGQASSGSGTLSTCATDGSEYYEASTGTCESCPTGSICDPYIGITGTCQLGEWLRESDKSCNNCAAGRYCDGVDRPTVSGSGEQMTLANYHTPVDCPAGHSCTTSSASACSDGEYSEMQDANCNTVQFMYANDVGGDNCPSGTNKESSRYRCQTSGLDVEHSWESTTNTCAQASGSTSWFGEGCVTCNTSPAAHDCVGQDYYYDLKCEPGTVIENGACTPKDTQEVEYREGIAEDCPTGHWTSGEQIVQQIDDTDKSKQC